MYRLITDSGTEEIHSTLELNKREKVLRAFYQKYTIIGINGDVVHYEPPLNKEQ